MSRGRITDPPPPPSRELTAPKMLADHKKDILRRMMRMQADLTYEAHRLRYVFRGNQGDEPEETYVCLCESAFDRRGFNMHVRDEFAKVM